MSAFIETFLEMIQLERGASLNTLVSYKRDLTQFYHFLKRKNLETVIEKDIQSYLASLDAAHLTATSKARKLSALRQFYKFLFLEGYANSNPCHRISMPKLGRRLPHTLSEEQVARLLNATSLWKGKEGTRLRAIIELLYATGARISEILTLPISSITHAYETRTLRLLGKGSKERIVPLSPPAITRLKEYMSIRDQFMKNKISSPWLFPSSSHQGYLTRQRFDQILKELAPQAGLERSHLSAHTLRHAFATHLLQHGLDLLSVQKLLGHADISTTAIYTHILPDRLKKTVETFHPLAQNT